jgi:hypothetical protein
MKSEGWGVSTGNPLSIGVRNTILRRGFLEAGKIEHNQKVGYGLIFPRN